MGAGQPTLIQSVQRALRLLEVVADHGGRARAKEVARAAGLPLATTYHLLRTCAHEGWLQHLDDGRALGALSATLLGAGDQPLSQLPPMSITVPACGGTTLPAIVFPTP